VLEEEGLEEAELEAALESAGIKETSDGTGRRSGSRE
jgi:hypothetical protein